MATETVVAAAVRGLRETRGRAPDLVWSAPGRVNLIGEHTDYNEGFVLPFAVAERTAVALAARDDTVLTVASSSFPGGAAVTGPDEAAPGRLHGWAGYPLGVAWAIAQARSLPRYAGADLFIASEVPAGAGLSSSAALEMAVACALADHWHVDLSAAELAAAGQRAENEVVGAPTGIMDQYAALLGQSDAAVFLDCRSRVARAVPLRLTGPGQPATGGLAIMLADTGERHAHAGGGYAARRASCERAASVLGVPALRDVSVADLARGREVLDEETFRRVRHVVTENARVEATVAALEGTAHRTGRHGTGRTGPDGTAPDGTAPDGTAPDGTGLEAGAMAEVGRQLTASHWSMRDDYEITTPALDLAVEAALAAGALGARMTGGGFGGSAITLIAASQVAALAGALAAAFADAGLAAPRVSTVAPSSGARKER